jgi:ligand-binding sensor domain-containing protein/DNA-binding CsgD family transcriptional regulator
MVQFKIKLYLLLISLMLDPGRQVFGQEVNIGIPPMAHYPKKVYGAGTQNWDAAQDSRGIMYWANNEGLLSFNGTTWNLFPVPNNTIIRSIAIDTADRIYVGAQSELGYFSSSLNGQLTFTSLVDLLPKEERSFEDVWDIVLVGQEVYFRTNHAIFVYDGKDIAILRAAADYHALFTVKDRVYVQTDLAAIDILEPGQPAFRAGIPGLNSVITAILPYANDTILVTSLKDGIFYLYGKQTGPWVTPVDRLLKEKRIYSATSLDRLHLVLGTSLDGVIIMDDHRRVVYHLNKHRGLQNNNILHTFCDQSGNLWLGLDNGIDYVALRSPLRMIYPDGDMQATGYSSTLFDGQLYLGVSNGAYVTPWKSYYDPESSPLFKMVDGSEGQIWNFCASEESLFMGHHEGAFTIHKNGAVPLTRSSGGWTFVEMEEGYVLGGFYNGLMVFQQKGNTWEPLYKLSGLNESCRIMVRAGKGEVWISHPYRGLYKVRWNRSMGAAADIRFYNEQQGLPSHLNNYVFSISGKAFFGTERGVYSFDDAKDQFIPAQEFNQWLGNINRVKFLKEDKSGNIWYLTSNEAGVLIVDDAGLKKTVRKKVLPELLGRYVGGFEHLYPIDETNLLIGAEQGFIHYRFDPGQGEDTSFHIILHKVMAQGASDSILFGGYAPPNSGQHPSMLVLHPGINNLGFSYTATAFEHQSLIEYRTWLEGFEETWSPWSAETKKNFTNLGSGEYTFHIEARIRNKDYIKRADYTFRIKPPWYKSNIALGFYGIGFIGLLTGFMMRQRQRFESEKAEMKETHQRKEAAHILAVEQSKAALNEMQHEKLEAEINYKNQELALTTMHLVQKAEILLTVQETLRQISEKNPSPEVRKEIQQLLNMLNFDVKLDEDWEHFAYHFDQVHVNFLKQLKEQFPQLSANDLKLCAYLRMNLSTKEIAPLMNISVRGVEGSRYRLRRKLDLPNDANLTEFMLNLPPTLPSPERSVNDPSANSSLNV